jgi:hypothetical protein
VTQPDTPSDSEVITEAMIRVGMNALRGLDLKTPHYDNRMYVVRAIYEDMRLARPKK